jgi:predicted transcriptional regulator of viral defense system
MGKIKYIQDIRQFFKESPVVDINSLKKFISKKDKAYTYSLISNMLKKKEINKITKRYYSKYNDPALLVFCFKPAYLGLQDALSFHNLWEQETIPVVLTTKNVRKGIRKVLGVNTLIKRLSKKYFFGFDYYKYPLEDRDIYLPYSDIEKTFIDMLHFKQPLDLETIQEFKEKIDKKKLKTYLKAYPPMIKTRVKNLLG